MIDVSDGTPGAELVRLSRALKDRRPVIDDLIRRSKGDAPIPRRDMTSGSYAAYEAFRKLVRVDWAGKIVRSRSDRMVPRGFYTASMDDGHGDTKAQQIWNRSRLDSKRTRAHRFALACGHGPLMTELRDGKAYITVEDPRNCLVEYDPVVPGLRTAAITTWHDPAEKKQYVQMHKPGKTWRVEKTASKFVAGPVTASWAWSEGFGEADGKDTGLPEIPVSEIEIEDGDGILKAHLPLLDAIDQAAFESAVIAVLQSFRQLAVMFPDGSDKDDDGNDIDWSAVLSQDPGAIWKLPGDTKFWESAMADLNGRIAYDKHKLKILAEVASTPLRSQHSDAGGGSAEGAASQKEDQVFAVEENTTAAGDAWCDIMSVAFRLEGDLERADREQIAMLWVDPSRRSLAERADAWSKTKDMDEFTRYVDVFGMTPAQYDEMVARRTAEELVQRAINPLADEPDEDPDDELAEDENGQLRLTGAGV